MTNRRGRRGGGRDVASVYDALAPAVLGWFRAQRMPDPEALTGDVFVSVARALPSFGGDDDALRRWVFTIARNQRVDAIRKAQRRVAEVPLDTVASGGEPSVDPVDGLVDPALVGALARLTDDQREVVVLRVVADLSVADVAELTGRTPGAVKMLVSRALDALRHDPAISSPDRVT